jgi:hypothetical protein
VGAPRDPRSSPEGLLDPVLALILSSIARVQPQMTQVRESLLCSMQQRLDPLVVHDLGAVDLRLEHETLGVYQDVALLRPFTFFPPSYPRCSAPTAVLFTDWESTTPALGLKDPSLGEP